MVGWSTPVAREIRYGWIAWATGSGDNHQVEVITSALHTDPRIAVDGAPSAISPKMARTASSAAISPLSTRPDLNLRREMATL